MGITNANKQISAQKIGCYERLKVTLALSASPDIAENPTDIMLVLDRSGSMAGSPLSNMKDGAKTFIDLIAQSTGGTGGQIGAGSRIGIVSFSDTAVTNAALTTSVSDLKDAVNSLSAGGSTNHGAAFERAQEAFDPLSANTKVIVMFTDGKTTAGPPPDPIAAQARAEGIIIYCIGLIGADGIDVSSLNEWASDPDLSHVAVTPSDTQLEELFAQLAANISKTGATDIVIDEIVSDDFVIIGIAPPAKGYATAISDTKLQWKIPALGVTANEGASLEFYIRHVAQSSGTKQVNRQISYQDAEGNLVIFPDPLVSVDCGIVTEVESCPLPAEITLDSCQDTAVVDLGEVSLQSLGQIVELHMTIRKVCPKKRVALAVILTEVGSDGMEYQRGMKVVTVPTHDAASCKDVFVKGIKFALPADIYLPREEEGSICGKRRLKARMFANYIDTGYLC